ncbi:hypothetical protein AgCh_027492 [Apium graveolens]
MKPIRTRVVKKRVKPRDPLIPKVLIPIQGESFEMNHMTGPGKNGATMYRDDFASDPKSYDEICRRGRALLLKIRAEKAAEKGKTKVDQIDKEAEARAKKREADALRMKALQLQREEIEL